MILDSNILNKKAISGFVGLEDKFNIKYNSKFDYSQAIYQGKISKIKIICKIHGEFWQTPKMHLDVVHGCPSCGKIGWADKTSYSTEEFIKMSKDKFGDKHDYSRVNYINIKTKVEIDCNSCGVFFLQNPAEHMKGSSCLDCSHFLHRKTTDEFIEKASIIHNNKYDYSQSVYTIGANKIKIICKTHGMFEQRALSHLAGYGCPSCSRMIITTDKYKNTPTTFYVVKYKGFYKIGITLHNARKRYNGEVSNINELEVLSEISFSGYDKAHLFEQFLIDKFYEYRYYGKKIFNKTGNTEVFTENIYELYLQECKND